jgi:hypothetical protein
MASVLDCDAPFLDTFEKPYPLSPLAGPLPPHAGVWTRHGLVAPDLSQWRAGDVVLSKPKSWPVPRPANPVVAAQSFLGLDNAEWTHVGVYNGHSAIWEALPLVSVQETPVGSFVRDKSAIRVLRHMTGRATPEALREAIVGIMPLRYDWSIVAPVLVQQLIRQALSAVAREADDLRAPVVCSVLVDRVLRAVFDQDYRFSVPGRVVLPADFPANRTFAEVDLRWHLVEPLPYPETDRA